jgi:hypothetical protein
MKVFRYLPKLATEALVFVTVFAAIQLTFPSIQIEIYHWLPGPAYELGLVIWWLSAYLVDRQAARPASH